MKAGARVVGKVTRIADFGAFVELEPGVEISANGTTGKVLIIGSIFTTVQTADGVVKIPNSELTSGQVRMAATQYQWQVQRRDEMRQRAAEAASEGVSQGVRDLRSSQQSGDAARRAS